MDSVEPLDCLVRNLRLRAPLSDTDAAAIRALPITISTVEPATYLMREADRSGQCGIVLSGFAYRQKIISTGERQALSLLIPGDSVDFMGMFLDAADHNVQMLTRGEVAMVQHADIEKLVTESPSIARAVILVILAEASVSREWIVNIGLRPGKERLAHLFCEIGARLDAMNGGVSDDYTLPMTQEELGDAVGLSPVHVNRSLKALEDDLLIERGRGMVRFNSWLSLRDVCGFNSRYLHLQPEVT